MNNISFYYGDDDECDSKQKKEKKLDFYIFLPRCLKMVYVPVF